MNNMKKALALVMSLALAASTFVVGAAYDDVPENHDNRIAINLLGDLGVMVGDAGTNDFRPEGTLKRSEAAAIVYRLRTGKTNADSYVGTTGFSDVSDSHWASGYINYCVNQGIIAGYPDGTFKPDQDVTYAEYIKMVVCALNLQKVETTTYIDMNTGVLVSEDKITTAYPTGYIALASDQQINEGIDYLNPNDKITRAEVAQGAYNAIFESYYKLDPKDADYVKDGTDYQHLAEQVFKLEKVTGVVTAFEDYTVANGKAQEANYFQVAGEGVFEYADFDPALVGQEVYVWEKQKNTSSASDKKVVAVVATEDNTVTTINTNDLKKDDGDYYYTDSEGKKQAIKSAELEDTELMLNGKAYDGMKAADLLKAVAECRLPMDLTFIDSDESPKSPTVISIKVYTQTEITSVTEDKLYVKNIESTFDANDIEEDANAGVVAYKELVAELGEDETDVYDLDAGVIDLKNDDDTVNDKVKYYDGIAKEDKVMIYADVNGNYDIRAIEEKEGTIKAMAGSKYRVDDEEVFIVAGDEMKTLMSSNNNSDAVAYLDPFTGYVINVDEGIGNVSDYYYVHLIQKQYATSSDYQLTAYDYEGNKVTLTFRDSDALDDVMTELYGEGYDMDTIVNKSGNTFGVVDKIGIFDVNSKGEITRWRSNNTDAPVLLADYDKDAEYNTKTGYVTIDGARVEVKPSSVVFGVEFEEGTNREKIDEVKTYVGSFPKTTDDIKDGVDYYLKKDDDDLKAALIRGTTKGGNTEFTNVTGYVLDERFEYVGDDKGYAVYKIATKGEVKEYETEVVDDTDLRDRSADSIKNCMVKFDLTTDGKILYGDKFDIDVVDGGIAGKDVSFKTIVNNYEDKGAFYGLSDFDVIKPGYSKMDEDEIYFGIVVESKDGKYVQLTDGTGASVIFDYADDVKAYRISNDKWDVVTPGTTGNITDSNKTYTTYAAFRVVDGDDVNDARITEIYTKTVESRAFNTINVQNPTTGDETTGQTAAEAVAGIQQTAELANANVTGENADKKTVVIEAPEGFKFTAADVIKAHQGGTNSANTSDVTKQISATGDKLTLTANSNTMKDNVYTVQYTLENKNDSTDTAKGIIEVTGIGSDAVLNEAAEKAETEKVLADFMKKVQTTVNAGSNAVTYELPEGYEFASQVTNSLQYVKVVDGDAGDTSVTIAPKNDGTLDKAVTTNDVTFKIKYVGDGAKGVEVEQKVKFTINPTAATYAKALENKTVSVADVAAADTGANVEVKVKGVDANYVLTDIVIDSKSEKVLMTEDDKVYFIGETQRGNYSFTAKLKQVATGKTKTVTVTVTVK